MEIASLALLPPAGPHALSFLRPVDAPRLDLVAMSPPPQKPRSLLVMAGCVFAFACVNFAIGFSLYGERGNATRAELRALRIGRQEERKKEAT